MPDRERPTIAPASHLAPRCIATEQDAIEAWGANSEMHLFAREWLRRPPSPPVTLTRADGTAARFEHVSLAGIGWPEPAPAWLALELTCDPQRSPPLECRIDGKAVELERGADGMWRPRRIGGDG